MIEDDIVRYASRFAGDAAHPERHRLRPRLRPPRGAAPARSCPPGAGPALVAAMDGLIERLQEEIPAVVEGDEFKRAQAQLAGELEAKNRAVIHQLESLAKTLGFGVRAVHGGVQTFPILHGKPVSAEQFDVLDESTKRALTETRGEAHARGREGGAARARAERRVRGGARGGVLEGRERRSSTRR